MTKPKSTGANPGRVARVNGLKSSGAAGKHGDRRLKRLKTRSARDRAEIRTH